MIYGWELSVKFLEKINNLFTQYSYAFLCCSVTSLLMGQYNEILPFGRKDVTSRWKYIRSQAQTLAVSYHTWVNWRLNMRIVASQHESSLNHWIIWRDEWSTVELVCMWSKALLQQRLGIFFSIHWLHIYYHSIGVLNNGDILWELFH